MKIKLGFLLILGVALGTTQNSIAMSPTEKTRELNAINDFIYIGDFSDADAVAKIEKKFKKNGRLENTLGRTANEKLFKRFNNARTSYQQARIKQAPVPAPVIPGAPIAPTDLPVAPSGYQGRVVPAAAIVAPSAPEKCTVQPAECAALTADMIDELKGTMTDLDRYIKEQIDTTNISKQNKKWLGAIQNSMESITCVNARQDGFNDACKKAYQLNYLMNQDITDAQLTKVNKDIKNLMGALRDIINKLISTVQASISSSTQTNKTTSEGTTAQAEIITLDAQGNIVGYSYACSADKSADLKIAQQKIQSSIAEEIKKPIDINQALKWYKVATNAIEAIKCSDSQVAKTYASKLLQLGKILYSNPSLQTLGTTMLSLKELLYELDKELTQAFPEEGV